MILGLAFFGFITLLIYFLQRSASGRAMLATRSSEVAARTSGISPAKAKFAVFALSAAIAGFGGAMFGVVNGSISSSSASPLVGLVWLAVAVTFGVRRPGGALLAGLSYSCTALIFLWLANDIVGDKTFHDLTTAVYFTPILFGLGAINLAKNPDGLLSLIGEQRDERRRKRELTAAIAAAEAQVHGGVVPEHERIHATADADATAAVGPPVEPVTPAASETAAPAGPAPEEPEVPEVPVPVTVPATVGGNGEGLPAACRHRRRRHRRRRHRHRRRRAGAVAPGDRGRLRRRRGAARRRRRGREGNGRRDAGRQRRREVDAVLGGGGAPRADAGQGPRRRT